MNVSRQSSVVSQRTPEGNATLSWAHGWAWVSFVAGLVAFLLSLTAPVPFIPILSCFAYPLGLVALATGWTARRRVGWVDDRSSRRRANWGMALGCLGWLMNAITLAVLLGLVGAVAIAWFTPHR